MLQNVPSMFWGTPKKINYYYRNFILIHCVYSQIILINDRITGNFLGLYNSRNARECFFVNFIKCEWTKVVQIMYHFSHIFMLSVFANEIATVRQTNSSPNYTVHSSMLAALELFRRKGQL